MNQSATCPTCSNCGALTEKRGTEYICHNCGNCMPVEEPPDGTSTRVEIESDNLSIAHEGYSPAERVQAIQEWLKPHRPKLLLGRTLLKITYKQDGEEGRRCEIYGVYMKNQSNTFFLAVNMEQVIEVRFESIQAINTIPLVVLAGVLNHFADHIP